MTAKEKLECFANHGISITYVAKKIGVDPSTLTKWLKGQKGITHKNEEKVDFALKEIIEELSIIIRSDLNGENLQD